MKNIIDAKKMRYDLVKKKISKSKKHTKKNISL